MIEFDKILAGEKPSAVFREILSKNIVLRKNDLGPEFFWRFPETDSIVVNMIWQWKVDDESYCSIVDDELDKDIISALKDAGYLELR